jgi:hypothetical protein
VDVAKQLDERDAAHKAEVEGLLVTSEADASGAKLELQHLKEQATKWEVDIARLNADLASKLQILFLLSCLTYTVQHTTTFSGITLMPTYIPVPNIFFVSQACSMPLLRMLRRPYRWIG